MIELPDEAIGRIVERWTSAQRLAAGAYLNRKVRDELTASVSDRHPDWSSENVNREVARILPAGEREDRYLTFAEALELDNRFREGPPG